MPVVTPNDRPKLVRNRFVIDFFVALFVLSLCPFDISVGVGAFVMGLNQISSLFVINVTFNDISIIYESCPENSRTHVQYKLEQILPIT